MDKGFPLIFQKSLCRSWHHKSFRFLVAEVS